jgi:prephenate dehydratase
MALHLPNAESCAPLHRSRRRVADPASTWDAAIAAPASEHYRPAVLAEGIGDNPDAITRFVLVSRPGLRLPGWSRQDSWWRSCATTTPARC